MAQCDWWRDQMVIVEHATFSKRKVMAYGTLILAARQLQKFVADK